MDHWWLTQPLAPFPSLQVRGWGWKFQPSNYTVNSLVTSSHPATIREPTNRHLTRTKNAHSENDTFLRSSVKGSEDKDQTLQWKDPPSAPTCECFRDSMPGKGNRDKIHISQRYTYVHTFPPERWLLNIHQHIARPDLIYLPGLLISCKGLSPQPL